MSLAKIRSRLFLTVPEAAQLLRVDPRTLRHAIDAGDVPAVRVSGAVRIPTDRFLAEVLLLPVEVTPDAHTDTAAG